MITRWLTRHREAALHRWAREARLATLLYHGPSGHAARLCARAARRRLEVWDTLLDLWTNKGSR